MDRVANLSIRSETNSTASFAVVCPSPFPKGVLSAIPDINANSNCWYSDPQTVPPSFEMFSTANPVSKASTTSLKLSIASGNKPLWSAMLKTIRRTDGLSNALIIPETRVANSSKLNVS